MDSRRTSTDCENSPQCALILERFGEQPGVPALARRFAGWPDDAAAVHAISTAAGVTELENAEPRP